MHEAQFEKLLEALGGLEDVIRVSAAARVDATEKLEGRLDDIAEYLKDIDRSIQYSG